MIELVSTDMLPYVCLSCGKAYMHRPAGYQVPAGAYSSGYCPEHKRDFEAHLYGRKAIGEAE